MRWWFIIWLAASGVVHAENKDCRLDRAVLDKAYAKARDTIGYSSPELDSCRDQMLNQIAACAKVEPNDRDCNPSIRDQVINRLSGAVLNTTGSVHAANLNVRLHLESANCKRKIAACYKTGQDQHGKANKLNEDLNRCQINADRRAAPAARTAADVDRQREADAVNTYLAEAKLARAAAAECNDKTGEELEQAARKAWADSRLAKTQDQIDREQMYCVNTDAGFRMCRFASDGQSFKETEDLDINPDKKNSSPARLDSCSGTLLGDGETVITAGHCIKKAREDILVHDQKGVGQYVTADCGNQFESTGGDIQRDFAVCRLNKKIYSNPVYFATYDPSVSGQCVQEQYVLRCGQDYFRSLSGKNASVWSYPAAHNLTESTGTLVFDPGDGKIYHNIPVTGGSSGSGLYIVDNQGRTIILGANSFADRYDTGRNNRNSGFPLFPYESYKGLRVQTMSDQKIGSAGVFFMGIMGR